MPLRAAIFDMDGTLVDSERVIMRAWLEVSQEMGYPMKQEDYASVIGLNVEESNAILASLLGGADALREVRHSVRNRLASLSETVVYPLKPGALELLRALRAEGIPCAVASSSSAQEIEDRLTRVGVLDFFQTVAGGDEVDRGKPDPAVYRLAASRLGVPPVSCLAFEDSAHGAAAASAAGATVVFVPDIREATPELAKSVTLVLGSLVDAVPKVPFWFGPR